MKCKIPFRSGLGEYGCGQCLPCRINYQRLWTIRYVLEAGQHQHNTFATLTFNENDAPRDGCVTVPTAQLFLRRLRARVGPVRYAIVGEYGERSWRPHYHALLFGLRDGLGVREAWQYGFVDISGVGLESAAYVAGYTLKGAHNRRGIEWHGKKLNPEFVRRSLKPGLGATSADLIGNFYTTLPGSRALATAQDVSGVVRQGLKLWPIGRYLKGRARNSAGLDSDSIWRARQLMDAELLKTLSQSSLNDLIKFRSGVSEQSGFRAEARYRRKSLEKKL